MRSITKLLFISLFLPCLFWADFSHAQEKTNHRALQERYRSYRYQRLVDSSVVRFINDDFVDDDSTEYILDDLLSHKDSLLSPFYFHVMSQLLWDTRWNESFSEITGEYQILILANNPKQILHELMEKSSGTHEDPHWRSYAHDLGEAISFNDNNLSDLYDTTQVQLQSFDDLVRIVQSVCRSKSERLFCDRFLHTMKVAWKQADGRNAPSFEGFELDSSEVYVGLSPKIFPIVSSLGDVHKEGRNPNFAGHFIVTNYVDCGTCCETYRIVDSRTGKVYDAPTFTVSDGCGIDKERTVHGPRAEYHLNSTLVVFRGSLDEKGFGTYYYNWEHGQLVLEDAVEDWLVPYSKTLNKTK